MFWIKQTGSSIIEIIVVILVLTTGIIGVYSILSSSSRLAATTEKRVQAINLAREGLEIGQNIRDTNWIRFSSDYENCWSTFNNDSTCIGNNSFSNKLNGVYVPILNGSLWTLWAASDSGVYINNNGLPVQWITTPPTNLCSNVIQKDCRSFFTRTIAFTPSGTWTLNVTSTVSWSDTSSTKPHIINLDLELKNWKVNWY